MSDGLLAVELSAMAGVSVETGCVGAGCVSAGRGWAVKVGRGWGLSVGIVVGMGVAAAEALQANDTINRTTTDR
jgi:hypothetical protein